MRRLEELSLIEVAPAERCSGARLLRKGQPFDLDFGPLRERRARELGKLDRMVLFAEEESCRRRSILTYFGEAPDWEGCGNCDVCRRGGGQVRKPELLTGVAEDITRKSLACVARMGNGYSAGIVTKVLTGSGAKNVRLMGFDKLSTFGILKDLTQDDVSAVLRALTRVGCLVQTEVSRPINGKERRYRVLNLSPLGARVMRRQQPGFEMLFPEVGPLARASVAALRSSRGGPDPVLDREQQGLFDKLREVRRALAAADDVPPYAMGTNRLLREIATNRPGSRGEMLSLHGMGEKMFDKVGQTFLEVVEAFAPG